MFQRTRIKGAAFWWDSLFSRGREEAHHLHGQLQALKIMLEVLPFNREAILLVSTRHSQNLRQLNNFSHHILTCVSNYS